jgi:transposase
VTPDQTGWKVGGRLRWLWAFVSEEVTVCSIQPGRGFEQATVVLPADYAGALPRDGYSICRRFQQALHQTCPAHLLRRCREVMEVAGPAAARFPQTVKETLQRGLQLRDLRGEGEISEHGFAVACGRLQARLERVLGSSCRPAANKRLANHLRRERHAIFTFLYCEGLDATNWRAEQAIRPAVVAREVWGGRRTSLAHVRAEGGGSPPTRGPGACRSVAPGWDARCRRSFAFSAPAVTYPTCCPGTDPSDLLASHLSFPETSPDSGRATQ